MFGGLKKKLEGAAMGTITGIVLKKAAAGELGPFVKGLYDAFVGYKTRIAAIIALPPLALEALRSSGTCEAFTLPCDMWDAKVSAILLSVAGAIAYLGQVDGALRLPPPIPPQDIKTPSVRG